MAIKKRKRQNPKLLLKKMDKTKLQRKRKKSSTSYARIDWEKASKFFQQIPIYPREKHFYPSVKELLHFLAAGGAVGLMFAFPGATPALGNLIIGENSYGRWQVKQTLTKMAKQKLVNIKDRGDGSVTVTITKNGINRALTYQLESMRLKKPKKWDGKWRVVVFDIPEKYKKVRDIFRMRLKQLGLYPFQESVFVSPYKCFGEIEFLRELYGVSFTVRYLLVEKIEDDDELRNYFSLK